MRRSLRKYKLAVAAFLLLVVLIFLALIPSFLAQFSVMQYVYWEDKGYRPQTEESVQRLHEIEDDVRRHGGNDSLYKMRRYLQDKSPDEVPVPDGLGPVRSR